MSAGDPPPDAAKVGFGHVLRDGEFRWLWLADVQSLLGDQLARVALSVLVYDRTRSGLASAAVYAATFLPALLGGITLGPLADRMPRRRLLVLGDLIRAALLGVMALPGLPLWAMVLLLVVAVGVGGPWKAAESALVADLIVGEAYVVSTGLRTATLQAAQLAGFAAGGAIVAAVGARHALALDAATFLVSAALIQLGLQYRPPAHVARFEGWLHGARAVVGHAELRVLLGFSWLIGLLVVPEGLAAPYAAGLSGGPGTVGLLLAAGPAGVLVGSLALSRLVPAATREALLAPLAVAAGLPLLVCVLRPGLVITLLLWAISGVCMAYQVQVVTEFVGAVPSAIRGQAIGVASSGLLAAQGVGLLAGGAVAQLTSASTAVAAAGGAAALLAVLAGARRRTLTRARDKSAGALT